MAYFQRLIFCLCVAFASWCPCVGHAQLASPVPTGVWSASTCFTGLACYQVTTSAAAACAPMAIAEAGSTGTCVQTTTSGTPGVSGYSVSFSFYKAGSFCNNCSLTGVAVTYAILQVCTTNASASGGVCGCNTGFSVVGSLCESSSTLAPCAAVTALENADGYVQSSATAASSLLCYGGYIVQGSFAAQVASGAVMVQGPFSCPGTACSSGNTAAAGPSVVNPAVTCSGGQVPVTGTVNGVSTTVCQSPSSVATAPTSATATAAAGSASSPSSGLGANAPPSATGASTSTVCTADSCTSTTTYTNSSGSTVGTSTATLPQATFCDQNPGASICTSSSWSASACSSPPVCTGDAVQCAIATQAFTTACAFSNTAAVTTQESAFTAGAAVVGDQTTALTSSVNVGPSSFSTSNVLGASAGLTDLAISVAGNPVVISFSQLNSSFAMLGYVLVGVTGLLCMRIVARG